jgi:hypothetical protein
VRPAAGGHVWLASGGAEVARLLGVLEHVAALGAAALDQARLAQEEPAAVEPVDPVGGLLVGPSGRAGPVGDVERIDGLETLRKAEGGPF